MTNSGTVSVNSALSLQGPGSFDNQGTVSITDGTAVTVPSALSGQGLTFTNDTGGSIKGNGTSGQFVMQGSNNTFDQGAGTTTGNPVLVEGDTLNYTGSGSSTIDVESAISLSGNIARVYRAPGEARGGDRTDSRSLDGEEITHRGKYYQTRKARLYTRSDRPIPLYVSSLVPGSSTFAGKHGDGLITVGGQTPEIYAQIMKNFEEGARAAGKNPAEMPKLIELNVAYTDDDEAAIACMRKYWAGTFVPALFDQKIYKPAMSAQNGEVVGPDTVRQKMCLSANADDHVTFANQYIDQGFTHLYFHCAGPDQLAFLEGYGRDVLPRLAEHSKT